MSIYISGDVATRLLVDDGGVFGRIIRRKRRDKSGTMCGEEKCSLAFLCALNTVAVVIAGLLSLSFDPFFNFLIPDLFINGLTNVFDAVVMDIFPIHGINGIWGAVFVWQLLWVIYSISNLFRSSGDGPLYLRPVLLTHAFYICYLFGLAFSVGWMFLWDRMYISVALVAILAASAFIFSALFISYRSLENNLPLLHVQGRHTDIWCIRILIHNGIAVYGNWAIIQSFLILASVLTYTSEKKIQEETSSTITLSIITAFMLAYALSDFFCFYKYSLFVLTPYAVWVITFCGMFANNPELVGVNPIFIVVLFAFSMVLAITKLYFICLHQITKSTDAEETTEFLRELDESRHLLK